MGFALTGRAYRKSVKAAFPAHWHDPLPHTHVALDDALEQGALFCNMLAEMHAREAALASLTAAPAAPTAPDGPGNESDSSPAT
jgi:hypothetical protein